VPNESGVRLGVREDDLGTAHVRVEGPLTRESHLERLRSTVARCASGARTRVVKIDVSRATAIDLQGVGVLLALRGEFGRRGVVVVVDDPQGPVRSRLEQTGTLDYLRGRQAPVE
jgi:anti-anti-sigma regulatory factor